MSQDRTTELQPGQQSKALTQKTTTATTKQNRERMLTSENTESGKGIGWVGNPGACNAAEEKVEEEECIEGLKRGWPGRRGGESGGKASEWF